MAETVLVTRPEFSKAEGTFRAAREIDVQPAAAAEMELARMVVERSCRAVIVGVLPYRGSLYEALGRNGGTAGAIIARFGVGHDGVDKALARRHNIVVTNTPGVLDASVAEHTIWLLGCLAKGVPAADARVRAGQFAGLAGLELSGKTLGLLGLGAIGRRVARIAHFGLGMRVIAADTKPIEILERELGKPAAELLAGLGVDSHTTSATPLLRQADAVSIHLPANEGTRHFLNAERLGRMKPGALLINTARGMIVDEAALYDALAAGHLGGAALDVFEHEPYRPVSPEKDLRSLPNVVLTPHIGSNTHEANRRMAEASLDNVANFFAGHLERLAVVSNAP